MENENFIGCVDIFAGTFAPRNWLFCGGQIEAISNFVALHSLIGTAYGGDGRVSFGLPDLRGRVIVGEGSGPDLTPRSRGQMGGAEVYFISHHQMPAHTHEATATVKTVQPEFVATSSVNAAQTPATLDAPGPTALLAVPRAAGQPVAVYANEPYNKNLRPDSISTSIARTTDTQVEVAVTNQLTGEDNPVDNMPPFTVIGYFICKAGIYPARN